VEAIPEGSLLLIQGNTLTKKPHLNLVNKLIKTSSPDNPRTRYGLSKLRNRVDYFLEKIMHRLVHIPRSVDIV
ncbi:hypothetical protein BVRB_038300, partial [Beta vulgaris subsp. vulgaris]